MKAIKIILAIIVVVAIAVIATRAIYWGGEQPGVLTTAVSVSKNSFIERIEQEIEELKNAPDSRFSKQEYRDIKYLIEDYHKNERLDPDDSSSNEQLAGNLSQNLYAVYAEKFIQQAFYVFKRTTWKQEDLNFIRSEYQSLQKSARLERNSPVDKKLREIQGVFSAYDEISNFIASSKNFSYSDSGLSARFPISEVKSVCAQVDTYRNNDQGNTYINNCLRLHDELRDIPQHLFSAHVRYLDNKITYWSGLFSNYTSQKAYADNLYTPLRDEIRALDNTVYHAANFDDEYRRLVAKWEADSEKAYSHFNK